MLCCPARVLCNARKYGVMTESTVLSAASSPTTTAVRASAGRQPKGKKYPLSTFSVLSLSLQLPASQSQCVQVRGDNQDDAKWEKGDNRTLTVPSDGVSAVSVLLEWGEPAEIEVTRGAGAPIAATAVAAAMEGTGSLASAGSGSDSEGGYASSGAVSGSMTSSFDDSMALLPQWQGKELRFMQSNEHTRWVGGWVGAEAAVDGHFRHAEQ